MHGERTIGEIITRRSLNKIGIKIIHSIFVIEEVIQKEVLHLLYKSNCETKIVDIF